MAAGRFADGASQKSFPGAGESRDNDIGKGIEKLARQQPKILRFVKLAVLANDGVPVGLLEAEFHLTDETFQFCDQFVLVNKIDKQGKPLLKRHILVSAN